MREFGFGAIEGKTKPEWWLHVLCSWRLESNEQVITGSFDWNEPEDAGSPVGMEWDPAQGGSLQEARLRDLLQDADRSTRLIRNNTEVLIVEDADVDSYGGVVIKLTGGFRLRIFPAGSRGEFWRVFRKDDLDSHYVCEIAAESSAA
jgi:hypothetical protein